MAWASARVMFISDAPYPASVGHAEAKKPIRASYEIEQVPDNKGNQVQTLLALHVELVFNERRQV